MPQMEALFYLILASQIFLLSYHYPMVYVKRVRYMLANYPAKTYPKLYPSDIYVHPEDITRKRIEVFKYINFAICLVGIVIIIVGIANGFELNEKGGAEIFVLMYFFLQFIPHLMLEIYEYRHHKHLRTLFKTSKRFANLTPRKLSNFISPIWVVLAVLLFIISTYLFLYFEGFGNSWEIEVYIALLGTSAVNIMFFIVGYSVLKGQKTNHLLAYEDQMTSIKSTVGIMVFTSIMMSLFLIATNSVREYGLDKWEPLLMSAYFQLIVLFGIGKQLRGLKIEDVDFEGYKAEA
ncbi:MAG: hypothetical protein HRU29_09520 [Rhizobiales bacterium]|nr:hypothetical protein [Hyphomicrobiales bacterium]NRB14628.1 hypothetical protein [Hyphomicrobiales bacterium]